MVKRKSPIDVFFTLGDKITKGDPVRKAQFDYYLMWIIFIGFLLILYMNIQVFYYTHNIKSLGWVLVIIAILWFQYGSMNMARMAYHMMRKQEKGIDYNKIEDVNEMMEKINEKTSPAKSKEVKRNAKQKRNG